MLLRQRQAGEWRAGLWDLPAEPLRRAKGVERLGTVQTKHVVTRHKITRLTHVWTLSGALRLAAAESAPEDLRWISLSSPEVAVGSALKKTLQIVGERFGDR